MNRLLALSLVVVLFAVTASGQVSQAPPPGARGADEVVRAFWKAVGDLDGDRVVACLDWPAVIVETSDRGTKPARTVVDADAVKAEIARSRNPDRKAQPGDFFGATVTHVEVQPLNATLVYVPHRVRFGGDGAGQAGREARELDAVAIVRKDAATQLWRIMVITVAQ
jgi:hypothetical protein